MFDGCPAGGLVRSNIDYPASRDGGVRADYVARAAAANDSPVVMLTASQLAHVVRTAVNTALEEREARQGAPAPPVLLDRHGIAAALGCSPSQINRLRKRGLPEQLFGDSPRFELEACMSWIRAQRKAP